MSKKSGVGINLIFLVLVLLLIGTLVCIGGYAYFHEAEHEAKPASAPKALTTTETSSAVTSVTTTVSSMTTTTATAATTTTASTVKISRLEYHGFNETITENNSDINYILSSEDSGDILHIYNGDRWTVSDFRDSSVASVSKDKEASSFNKYINSEYVTESKSDIGISAEIKDGKTLAVKSFGGECTELKIVSNNDKYAEISYKADTKKGTLEADLTDGSFLNGLYFIHGEYTEGGKTYPLNTYLFVNCKSDDEKDSHYYLCSLKQEREADVTSTSDTETTSETTTVSAETTTTAA